MEHQFQIPYSVQEKFPDKVLNKLRQNFISMIENENIQRTSYVLVSAYNLNHNQKIELIQLMLNMTADGIYLLNQSYAQAEQANLSNEFNPILNYLTDYFFEVEDFRTDNFGPIGWIDDSYLCFSGLQQINQIYASIYGKKLIEIELNPYIIFMRGLLSQDELLELDKVLLEKFASIDWKNILLKMAGVSFVNMIFGNNRGNQSSGGNSDGKSWERQMFESASKLGIPINF
ncbi:hypothetical protein M3O96_00060 [Aquiflexum sp. TKW24L]|uniref:hypothetical protein n=1 Tax=Aquiflexum sp. TKW24L TaxID=2942212 RepID=UPI0020BE2355|nr:hypothetical protein [Aquiflexum sp. TKW24L]MCL6257462.1 hypothetical protein [Aquiflexum sp. TKW24L]